MIKLADMLTADFRSPCYGPGPPSLSCALNWVTSIHRLFRGSVPVYARMFWRSLTYAHVRQLDTVHSRLLINLSAWRRCARAGTSQLGAYGPGDQPD